MSKNLKTNLFLVAAMASWGLGTVLTKIALNDFSSWVLLPFQLISSVVFLGAFLFLTRNRKLATRQIRSYGKIALLGVLNPGIAYALGLSGLARIPASISVVLWAVEPLLITLIAFVFIRTSVRGEIVLAVILATIGVLLIIGRPSGQSELAGVLLTLSAIAACAGYSIILNLMNVKEGSLRIVFVQQLAASLFAIALMSFQLILRGLPAMRLSLWSIGEAVIAGILYYGIAFWMYVSGLRRTTAAKAGTFLTLIPVFGLVFSILILGERINGRQLIGSMVVIGAVISLSIFERLKKQSPHQS
ncbi:MAG: DMT family transporter [Actinobacteria bacterium]|nr:DMT family transporter [Actinomycetota bacterium]